MPVGGFRIDYDAATRHLVINAPYGQGFEDYAPGMGALITRLMELKLQPKITVVAEAREYSYSDEESHMLYEIAQLIEDIRSQNILSMGNILKGSYCEAYLPDALAKMRAIFENIKYDPVESYSRIVREARMIKHKIKQLREGKEVEEAKKGDANACRVCFTNYYHKVLAPLRRMFEETMIIRRAKELNIRGRQVYRKLFRPSTRPTFMYTRLETSYPANAELVDRYRVGDAVISVFRVEGRTEKFYHMSSGEFNLDYDEYEILEKARRYIGAHEPSEAEMAEPELFRKSMYNLAVDLIRDIANTENRAIGEKETHRLADILARYTAGIGIIEILLADEKIQDVLINSPVGTVPVFVRHADFGDCVTNIFPSASDAEAWATRFRMHSGRPLDEANPVLDTEIEVKGGRARVAAITRPLSPDGLAFALRRFRLKPWTFPLFINARMIDAFSAGLIWFIIDGARTMLVAGTRSSGKTSFLSSCMVQIMPSVRIVSVEDTMELPVSALRSIGFNIERLKSRSVITHLENELPAEEALRTALRLGDSALIVGEVRSREAIALYEAMRIGALANVVAGTIHGESAYGVFDRVVNDLGVPPTSFKATDIIITANTLRSPDGLRSFRRIVEITEVRKHWQKDPLQENGFIPLMQYNAAEDRLKPTQTLLTGESEVLNSIASRVKEWQFNWEAVWSNINLRARILHELAEYGRVKPHLIEAESIVKSNAMFHTISESVLRETGALDSNEIFRQWQSWMKMQLAEA